MATDKKYWEIFQTRRKIKHIFMSHKSFSSNLYNHIYNTISYMSKGLRTILFRLKYICSFYIFLNKKKSLGCYFLILFCHKHTKLKLKIHQVSNDTEKIFELFKIYEENRLPSIFNRQLLLLRYRFTKLLINFDSEVLIFSAMFSCL